MKTMLVLVRALFLQLGIWVGSICLFVWIVVWLLRALRVMH